MVTTVLAVWGAGLSTYLQLTQRKPRARVHLQHALVPALPMVVFGRDREIADALSLTLENYGQVDLTFDPLCCEFQVNGYKSTIVLRPRIIDPSLPATIKHGQRLKVITLKDELISAFTAMNVSRPAHIRASVKDAIGREFRSRWVAIQ